MTKTDCSMLDGNSAMDKPRRARTVQRYREYQGKLVRTGKPSKSWEVSQNELWGTESWPREKQMQRNQGGSLPGMF